MSQPTLAFRNPPDWRKLKLLLWLIPAILVIVLGLTMYYTVPPDSQGVVLRFGRFSSVEEPGLHFKIPFGVDRVETVPVKRQLKLEFGFATPGACAWAGGRSRSSRATCAASKSSTRSSRALAALFLR